MYNLNLHQQLWGYKVEEKLYLGVREQKRLNTTVLDHLCQDTLKSVNYSYFHSLISYGIIFCGSSSNSVHVFRLQKRAIRIITGSRQRDSCRELFKKLKILPLHSQYIFSLLLFIVNNRNIFHANSDIHDINTMQNSNLRQPQANLTMYQKVAYYSGIKVFNSLPISIKKISCDVKRFKLSLYEYLHLRSFCTLGEYFNSAEQIRV
jgi:hypothetical protein